MTNSFEERISDLIAATNTSVDDQAKRYEMLTAAIMRVPEIFPLLAFLFCFHSVQRQIAAAMGVPSCA